MYEERAKSLRWLAFNFPHIDHPQDDSDRMCNCINLYCTQAADALEELSRQRDRAYARLCELCGVCPEGKRNPEDCEIAALDPEPPKGGGQDE